MGRPKKPRRMVGDPGDAMALTPLVEQYIAHLVVKNYSTYTTNVHEHHLQYFLAWCEERGVVRACDVTRPMIQQYQRSIFHYRTKEGRPLAFDTQQTRIRTVMLFFRWLTREDRIVYNPATDLDLPRVPKRLPKFVLTNEEVDLVMNQPDVTDAIGIRDRAILEVLYATGVRRSELRNIKVYDIDLDFGTVMVREGKGRKDRIVPMGERAIAWLQKYLGDVRSWFAGERDEGFLFLTHRGEPMSRNQLTHSVHGYIEQAGITKKGSCHLFRHAMATQMLENGADIRFIQQMLGHSNLETTEVYTHVSIRKLKQIHAATHPAARLAKHEPERAPAEELDFGAMHEHVEHETERVEQSEGERRFEKRAGSYALKVLRLAARSRRKPAK